MPNALKGLTLPLVYKYGSIYDGAGKQILHAERNSLETPLAPHGRDAILRLVTVLLNRAFEYDEAEKILHKEGY